MACEAIHFFFDNVCTDTVFIRSILHEATFTGRSSHAAPTPGRVPHTGRYRRTSPLLARASVHFEYPPFPPPPLGVCPYCIPPLPPPPLYLPAERTPTPFQAAPGAQLASPGVQLSPYPRANTAVASNPTSPMSSGATHRHSAHPPKHPVNRRTRDCLRA
jgi:hypothetical protein